MTNITWMKEIKVNEEFTVVQGFKAFAVSEGGEFFCYLQKDGKVWDTIMPTIYEDEHEENIATLISEVIAKEFDGETEVEQQAIVEGFTHDVWVAVVMIDGEVCYHLSTLYNGTKEQRLSERHFDANRVSRKTWKGLVNYINRFI